ncbi:hypothetical protein DPMN_053413 [Dreissena polymorpha]|uniref:Uncharacterized protein n=1 Tax=Dreissena polymorpha TaxID=45954 RepID=A0A9D4CNK3_DREPO|nr:hypothetical protein DPMN_053413 [Dreissena polymorpha]
MEVVLPLDNENLLLIERERAFLAAQQNQPLTYNPNNDVDAFEPLLNVEANEEAGFLQTYPVESPDGYMKKS